MSLKNIQQKKSDRIDLNDLPERVEAQCLGAVWKEDNNGRECLYLTWQTKDDKEFTQKYTPMHLNLLEQRMTEADIKDLTKAGFIALRRHDFKIGFPRMMPEGIR